MHAAVFGFPGPIGAYHLSWVAAAAIHMYRTGWVICFVAAVVFYFVVNRVFPAKVFPARYESTPKSFEKPVEIEGCFDGEPLVGFGGINSWEVEDHASGGAA